MAGGRTRPPLQRIGNAGESTVIDRRYRADGGVMEVENGAWQATRPPYKAKRLRTRGEEGKYELSIRGAMGRGFITWLGLGVVAIVVAVHAAQAGDRRDATIQRAAVAARGSDFGGNMRMPANNSSAAPMKGHGRGELAFIQVTPSESRSIVSGEKTSRQWEDQKTAGPTTSPRERRAITLFRFNPNVSVQPVIGGINGAQISVGF